MMFKLLLSKYMSRSLINLISKIKSGLFGIHSDMLLFVRQMNESTTKKSPVGAEETSILSIFV